MNFSTMQLHDIDRVSLGEIHSLDGGSWKTRSITFKSGEMKFTVTLFASDARLLDVIQEGP